jgi:hypothetical protein
MVTIIADNYYGYCKKEVKTVRSASRRTCSALRRRARRRRYRLSGLRSRPGFSTRTARSAQDGDVRNVTLRLLGRPGGATSPEGYAVDRQLCRRIFYVPENAEFNVRDGFREMAGTKANHNSLLLLSIGETYVLPSGYQGAAGEAARRHVVAAGGRGGATARSATNRPRSRAEANRRSRNPFPACCWRDRCS